MNNGQKGHLEMFCEKEKQAVCDVFVKHHVDTCMDPLEFLGFIQYASTTDIFHVIRECKDDLVPVQPGNIPQLSEVKDMFRTVTILNDCETALDMTTLGYYLIGSDRSAEAQRKYGETHYNFACQLGFAIKHKDRRTHLTDLGTAFYFKTDTEKMDITKRLILEVPLLQQSLLKAETQFVNMVEELGKYLSPSTVQRRRSNMHNMLRWLEETADVEMMDLLFKIRW